MSMVVTNTQVVTQQQQQPPPQVVVPPPQPQVVVIQQSQPQGKYGCCGMVRENYKASTSNIFGWIQIVGAIFCIIFNSVGMHIDGQNYWLSYWVAYYYCFHTGYGIWAAIFYIFAGGFALGAGIHKTTGMIVTNMVFSIIAAVMGFGALSTGIGCVSTQIGYDAKAGGIAMAVLLMLILLMLFICTIWSSALCCSVVCCGARNGAVQATVTAVPGQVVYTNNPAQPPMYQQNQPGASQPMAPGQPGMAPPQPANGEMPPKY